MKSTEKHRSKLLSRNYVQMASAVIAIVVVVVIGVLLLVGSHAQSPYVSTYAANGQLGGSASLTAGGSNSNGQAVQFGQNTQNCTVPTTYPAAPNGGMAYTNWYFDMSTPISSLQHTVVIDNNPGTSSQLFLQLYDGNIDGTGQYYGLQTSGLAIFSEFGTTNTSDVDPAPGATAVSGTNEGDFVSLRYNFGSLPAGTYTVTMERGSADGAADWFDYYVALPGKSKVLIGAILFPRANASVPASFSDGGGTWTEDFQNNGATLYPVPLWHVSVLVRANGTAIPDSAKSAYSAMPDSDQYAESNGGAVDQVIGGSTPRCHPAGWLWYQINTGK
jgi:hypothetical protein